MSENSNNYCNSMCDLHVLIFYFDCYKSWCGPPSEISNYIVRCRQYFVDGALLGVILTLLNGCRMLVWSSTCRV